MSRIYSRTSIWTIIEHFRGHPFVLYADRSFGGRSSVMEFSGTVQSNLSNKLFGMIVSSEPWPAINWARTFPLQNIAWNMEQLFVAIPELKALVRPSRLLLSRVKRRRERKLGRFSPLLLKQHLFLTGRCHRTFIHVVMILAFRINTVRLC